MGPKSFSLLNAGMLHNKLKCHVVSLLSMMCNNNIMVLIKGQLDVDPLLRCIVVYLLLLIISMSCQLEGDCLFNIILQGATKTLYISLAKSSYINPFNLLFQIDYTTSVN